ncbi:unnamed protein product [Adineta ricciae]|uniref:C2H2-type domain-containing protein n=1 Tax=Adineta ricciae TaxID=249248 RepID=A0A816CAM7_ADIRI|nr:unnamed protein product [Adineta ricciae]
MAGQDASRYQPGRGLPPYLLSRNYADSSTDSDGASRIFAESSCSMTSDKDSDCSSASHMPVTIHDSSVGLIQLRFLAAPSMFEYQTNNATRSIDEDRRTLRDETSSGSYGTNSANKASSAPFISTVSHNSLMDCLLVGSILSNETKKYNRIIISDYDYNSNPISHPEDMFTPYVPILSNIDNRPLHGRNESFNDMIVDEVETQSITTADVEIPENINFNECCRFGDKTVHGCRPTAKHDAIPVDIASQHTGGSEFTIDNRRDTMNRILADVNLSPIRSQTTKPIKDHSKSGLRRLISKFTRGSKAFQDELAETLMPGRGQELIQMAQLQSQARETQALELSISNEMVQSLKQVYDIYVKQRMPFIEQVRILSLLPRSWKYEKVMSLFGCTRHAVTAAHQMHDDEEYLLNKDQEPAIRQRAAPEKIKHFISWLVESNTLVSGTYGLTNLRMDNGEKYELPKQIIQSQRSHALVDYKKYCDETGFQGLGKSKLYDILNSIKPAEQRIVAGLDEFVVEGVEAWLSLSKIVETLPIRQADRKRLLKQIDMGEQYKKIRHTGHCSDDADCITHCTIFGLSDSKRAEYYSNCNHTHTAHCPDCINIIITLDEISQQIPKIGNKDFQREARFDFENASEHIVEWSRHNLRAARQDTEKKSIISQMEEDEAFCTFDWGQKILPQKHREPQSAYFGKKGMSVLMGSFVWKDQVTRLASESTTTTNLSLPTYSTDSYIVAITGAAQTELDTLSAGEIITKQFKTDHPHIKKLHKRTDNAGNFSSHSTPEVEKVICERMGIELLTRDYSEVQKGEDICNRMFGVNKARMRSWEASGNDLLSAIDIKEGMEYAGGIKHTKVAVAEIVAGQGYLEKTNIPNVSTLRSIRYGSENMNVFKATSVGTGFEIPYKQLDFEANMRIVSPFGCSINEQESNIVSEQRNDRRHHFLKLCPVSGCTATFESNTDLESHISANLHNVQPTQSRTANDIARLHLTELIRTTGIDAQQQATLLSQDQDMSHVDLTTSAHYQKFSSIGWGLRTRKHTNPMSDNVKNFIEKVWLDSQESRSKFTVQEIQQQIRTKRCQNGEKIFQTQEYPTLSQIKYRLRKIAQKYGVTPKHELMSQLMKINTE